MKESTKRRLLLRLADGAHEVPVYAECGVTQRQVDRAQRDAVFAARYYEAICRGAQMRLDAELREERRLAEREAWDDLKGRETHADDSRRKYAEAAHMQAHPRVFSFAGGQ